MDFLSARLCRAERGTIILSLFLTYKKVAIYDKNALQDAHASQRCCLKATARQRKTPPSGVFVFSRGIAYQRSFIGYLLVRNTRKTDGRMLSNQV